MRVRRGEEGRGVKGVRVRKSWWVGGFPLLGRELFGQGHHQSHEAQAG